jgi:integrase
MEKSGLSRSYQKKVKNMINKVYSWGMEYNHIIGSNVTPLEGLLISKAEDKAPDTLSIEEIRKFLSAAKAVNHHWYPVWAFAILTGMRSGELHALGWEQIDLEKNLILVDRSYDSNMKNIGPTKGRYWRTVPINDSLRNLILDLKRNPELVNSGMFYLEVKIGIMEIKQYR